MTNDDLGSDAYSENTVAKENAILRRRLQLMRKEFGDLNWYMFTRKHKNAIFWFDENFNIR